MKREVRRPRRSGGTLDPPGLHHLCRCGSSVVRSGFRGNSRVWGPRGGRGPGRSCTPPHLEQQLRKYRGKLAPGVAVSLNRDETTNSRVPQLALLLVQLFARQVTGGEGFHILRKSPQNRNNVNDKNARQMRWWGSYSGGQWEPSRRALQIRPKVPPSDHGQFLEISVANGSA